VRNVKISERDVCHGKQKHKNTLQKHQKIKRVESAMPTITSNNVYQRQQKWTHIFFKNSKLRSDLKCHHVGAILTPKAETEHHVLHHIKCLPFWDLTKLSRTIRQSRTMAKWYIA